MSRPAPSSEAPSSVVVFGAGTMGSGMAVAFARAGSRVRIVARRAASLELGRRRMVASLGLLDEEGLLNEDSPEQILDRVTDHDPANVDLAADLIIESITEDLDRKRELLSQIEERAPENAIVASNTSSISLRDLSEGLRRPSRFAGYHWFNPAELVELVEVVAAPETERSVIETLVRWSKGIGKRPVILSREIEGFVANRLQYALIREAYALVESGVCTPQDVDEVVKAGLGPRWAAVGPFETMDLAGLDVHEAVARDLWPKLSVAAEPPEMLKELMARGALGVKSGLGLRGRYEEATIAAITRRRAQVLVTLSRLDAGDDAQA